MADENPYRSPETDPLPAEKASEQRDRLGNSGCLVLFLLGLPLLDTFGVVAAMAGPYWFVVELVGLGGFVCGAVVGGYVSVRILRKPWWSSCRWAIYGLIGLCSATAIFYAALVRGR